MSLKAHLSCICLIQAAEAQRGHPPSPGSTEQGNNLKTGTEVQDDHNTEAFLDDFQQQRAFMPSQSLPVLGGADGPQTYRVSDQSNPLRVWLTSSAFGRMEWLFLPPVQQTCHSQILSGSYTSPYDF